jgi:hypothetical protein
LLINCKAIEDFEAWYDNNKEFQNLKLYDFIVDDGGILYDGYDISPELKNYYIEFALSELERELEKNEQN